MIYASHEFEQVIPGNGRFKREMIIDRSGIGASIIIIINCWCIGYRFETLVY